MKYFDRELIAWRAESGQLTVMDAYCEHLGAHLGYGGTRRGRGPAVPVPRLAVESTRAATSASRTRTGPTAAAASAPIPVVERNESVYIWHDVDGREPFFDAPDVFASFADGSSAADYYPQQRLYREALELHPQYVLENGVDFAHFKFVHQTPIVPVFTRHDFDEPVSYVDFTITFEGDDEPDDRGRQERCRSDQRRPGHRGDEELGHGRQPDHLCDHARRREHLRRPLHGLHRPQARQTTRRGPRPRRGSSARR